MRNDSGSTPFREVDGALVLPADWVADRNTGGFANLDTALTGYTQELERERWNANFSGQLMPGWRFQAGLLREEKQGTRETGAAFYIDASAGHAAILPEPVDQVSTELDLALEYIGERLVMNGSWEDVLISLR